MKKVFIFFLSIALLFTLGACAKHVIEETTPDVSTETSSPNPEEITDTPQPSDDQFVFTRENFPKLDGSTSMVPLAQAAAAVLLGEDADSVSDLINFNRTSQSFRNLMYGQADALIVAEPAESVWDEIEQEGFEYEMAQISTDALIFVVSRDNPIDSLTTEQIQRIYSGEITNWSQVGGNDVEIIPFQRNAEAGSQAAMLRLVMKDLTMMEPPSEYLIDSMAGLMEAMRNFDGSEGAIGYSVYYYANDMRMADGLKIIAVDGIDPNPETIRAAEYPFLAPSYTVIPADAAEDSPARILFNWLQSEQGQYLVASQGYVSVMEL